MRCHFGSDTHAGPSNIASNRDSSPLPEGEIWGSEPPVRSDCQITFALVRIFKLVFVNFLSGSLHNLTTVTTSCVSIGDFSKCSSSVLEQRWQEMKISPVRDWRSTPPASQVIPSSKSRDTKTRTYIKNPARSKSAVICQLPLKMAEIDFENGRISNFQRYVTLSLTLDRATWHTVVHHSSTSTCTPNFIRIGETFCGRTYGQTSRRLY